MVDYNIVKHCRLCRKRFVISKEDYKKNYCDVCTPKISKSNEVKK